MMTTHNILLGIANSFPIVRPNCADLRICWGYSVATNKFSFLKEYPVTTIEQLQANLSEGKEFTKIDLPHSYH